MLEGGLSIHTCFLHVLTTIRCCEPMLFLTLSVSGSFISKGQAKSSKAMQGIWERAKNIQGEVLLEKACEI